MHVPSSRSLLAAVVMIGTAAVPLAAQRAREGPPLPVGGGVRLTVAQPIGEFKITSPMVGVWAGFPLVSRRAARLLAPGRRQLPELRPPDHARVLRDRLPHPDRHQHVEQHFLRTRGSGVAGAIRRDPPYVNAMAGWTVFWTQSSAEGASENESLFRTTNLRDNILSAAAGGGVRIPIAERVMLDINARRNFNGRARYLTRDSFGDGSNPTPLVRESEVNMWTYAIGLSFGF